MSSDQSHFKAENLFTCKGLTAVVTGGGTGIGLMQAIALSQNGAKVFITSRNEEKLKDVAEKYGKGLSNGGSIVAVQGDISNKEGIVKVVQEIEGQSKDGINVLFNNAGIAGEGSREGWEDVNAEDPKAYSEQLLKSEFKEWDDILHTNVAGQYFTAAAFIPLLAAGAKSTKGYASQIVNVSSISGLMKGSSSGQFAYASSKAALVQLSKVMAREFLPLKIRVNQIAPGIFPSEMTAGDSDSTTHKSDLSDTGKGKGLPSGRPGKEEDMAAATLYLASYAGVFVNGQFIAPDGGATVATPSSI
ncbi:uncharacterized protein I303_103207 [Kwoniella dejecticola CBS 10117]|uniref:Short-chain dehydrogenase n=1 Tax=Kwoniella dejecticola CBS 10117 TaxID=1296121 RepID=A0A1A6AAW3_9TREE|nr:uncharacterized protein I303_03231 [Kwoniella dejecticola CBS 10117]OBR87207.1 hypothetical protein I303_03231 [Kwoniella dejecticola CBS 10117]